MPDVPNIYLGVLSGGRGSGASPWNDDLASTLDPTRGFHLLISVYFMVRENSIGKERMPGSTGTAADVVAGSVMSGFRCVRS